MTAENGDTKTYTVTVYRKNSSPSNENRLSALDLSGVTLSPSFAADKTGYTGRVAHGTSKTNLSATAMHVGAMMQYYPADADGTIDTGTELADADLDADGFQVNLTAGANTIIYVRVTPEAMTAPDAASAGANERPPQLNDYKVTVFRENPRLKDNANLAGLVVNEGSTGGSALTLDPATFNVDTTKYTVRVANTVDTVEVATGTTGTRPSDATGGATVSIPDDDSTADGKQVFLTAGAKNDIDITVTAENGDTKTYTVTVYRKSSSESNENRLRALALSGVTLSPSFAAAKTTGYTGRVANGTSKATLSTTARHVGAMVAILSSCCRHRNY